MKNREVKIDAETLDCITVAGLREWRETITETESTHAEDRDTDKRRVEAIDILLAYCGAVK